MTNGGMMKLYRNMQVCRGDKSCGDCLTTFSDLAIGPVAIARWAYEHAPNRVRIDRVIDECPVGALTLEDV